MKMMPPDVISHENQLQHLSEPSIFMLDVFRTADDAGQIFIPHVHQLRGLRTGKPTMAIGYILRMCARHVDSTNPGRSNLVGLQVVFRSKPMPEAEMSNRLIPPIINLFLIL